MICRLQICHNLISLTLDYWYNLFLLYLTCTETKACTTMVQVTVFQTASYAEWGSKVCISKKFPDGADVGTTL